MEGSKGGEGKILMEMIVPLCPWQILRLAGGWRSSAHSNMASSWSARSSNMLPMSSRMLTVLLDSAVELDGKEMAGVRNMPS